MFQFATEWVGLGFDCNAQDRDGNTVLHLAASNCARAVTALLSAAPVPHLRVDERNKSHETPLHCLLRLEGEDDPYDAIDQLCQYGANVALLNACGENALQMTLALGHSTAVLKLLCSGPDVALHARPADSFTAVHLAALACASGGSLDPLRLLLAVAGEVLLPGAGRIL